VNPVYLDYHATTPVDPRVLSEMLPFFTERFGNPHSKQHAFGWEARDAAEKARAQVAALINATAGEITFTSGATESSNLALKGAVEARRARGNHVVTVATEHKSVLDVCLQLRQQGLDVTVLGVDAGGLVDLDALGAAMTPRTILVSVMAANNEIGTVQPLAEIGALCRSRGVLLHSDAVQGVGKVPFDVDSMKIDLASVTAHKIYGPKGIGALYVRRKPRVRIAPIIDGGGHERGMRSGTLNVAGIVGFGKAAEIARTEMAAESARVLALRERLRAKLDAELDLVILNGSLEHRLPGNLNVSFAYVEGEALMMAIKDVAVSSGSACTSASLEPSYVLRALGVEEDMAHSSIRFGLGRFNTEAQVDTVARLVVDKVKKLREMSPLYEMAREGVDLKSIAWTAH
jgi:cysteine desulfurase